MYKECSNLYLCIDILVYELCNYYYFEFLIEIILLVFENDE